MITHFRLFFLTFITYVVLDLFWLSFIMRDFYRHQLQHLARMSEGYLRPDFLVMFSAYIIIAIGLVAFVITPNLTKPVTLETFGWGALYGFVGYGIYELTNYAVLANWPVQLVFVDIAWGTVVNGVVTVLVVAAAQYFKIV